MGRYLTGAGAVALVWGIRMLLLIMTQICVVFSGILSFSTGKGSLAVLMVLGFCVLAFFLFHFLHGQYCVFSLQKDMLHLPFSSFVHQLYHIFLLKHHANG